MSSDMSGFTVCDGALRTELKVLAQRYTRYGWPTLHDMLRMVLPSKLPIIGRIGL